MTIQEAKNTVNSSIPSIWSREDVLSLLDKIDEGGSLSDELIEELTENIVSDIESEGADIIDDYDLSMNHREVEVDSVDFNTRALRELVKSNIENCLKESKEEVTA